MIDVGCGTGRHCRRLALGPYDVWGIDTSAYSIRHAKKHESSTLHFFQRDMRRSYGENYFDYVFNFFTSFGYFESEQEHGYVIRHMSKALKTGGKLVMDYMNVNYVSSHLRATDEKEIDGIAYNMERWEDDRHFFKRIIIQDKFPETPEHVEQVAKFKLEDFEKMFAHANLRMEAVYGDYELGDYDSLKSPRLIMVAGKNSQ